MERKMKSCFFSRAPWWFSVHYWLKILKFCLFIHLSILVQAGCFLFLSVYVKIVCSPAEMICPDDFYFFLHMLWNMK